MSLLYEVVASDFIEHQPGMPQGRDRLKQVIRTLHPSFPDLNYTVVHTVKDGSTVWAISADAVRTQVQSRVRLRPARRSRSM